MILDHDESGSAFPNPVPSIDDGMSLRDYFASQALIGILGSRIGFLVDVGTDNAAEWAYHAADRMLAERQKRPASDDLDDDEQDKPAEPT